MAALAGTKRLVIAWKVLFTQKAEREMAEASLTPESVYESILNAPAICLDDVLFLTSEPPGLSLGTDLGKELDRISITA